MAMAEDLATLFSRNLSLHNPPPVAPVEQAADTSSQITYSISQHYHHSAHVAKQTPRSTSEPPQTDQLTTEIILSRHGVDAATLFPSQIELFRSAEPGQQMRLIELWRISPPNYGGHALAQDLGTWPATSLQQEEEMAKLRHERQMMQERIAQAGHHQHSVDNIDDAMSDESTNGPLTPIQGGDGRWNAADAEPYMSSGYELLARREYELSALPSRDIYSHFGTSVGGPSYNTATDPVYKHNATEDWQNRMLQQQQEMENQYGSYMQGQVGAVGAGFGGHDEEML
ncbi:hypothetical protein F5884DRAFT_177270 [Xylogone sp. PMI_703]|nr:hypothetical protein F5884DRAFT_177270 [Xylogone sp. PMI_703]